MSSKYQPLMLLLESTTESHGEKIYEEICKIHNATHKKYEKKMFPLTHEIFGSITVSRISNIFYILWCTKENKGKIKNRNYKASGTKGALTKFANKASGTKGALTKCQILQDSSAVYPSRVHCKILYRKSRNWIINSNFQVKLNMNQFTMTIYIHGKTIFSKMQFHKQNHFPLSPSINVTARVKVSSVSNFLPRCNIDTRERGELQ